MSLKRYNQLLIDGAANNDVFGLSSTGSNGGQAGTQPVSLETIDQIQVNVAPYDVRQSGFTGGSINAITKSGTNQFHGSLYGYGYNQKKSGEFTDLQLQLQKEKDAGKYYHMLAAQDEQQKIMIHDIKNHLQPF